jgi:transposase
MYSLIATAKLNGVDPPAWLADILGRIGGTPMSRLDEFLLWNWSLTAAAEAA